MDSPKTFDRSEDPIAGIEWRRRQTRRIRPVVGADGDVLTEMSRGSGISHRLLPEGSSAEAGCWPAEQVGRLVECDHRITAAVALQPGHSGLEPGRHPWSKVSPTEERICRPEAPPVPELFVTNLLYHAAPYRTDETPTPGPPVWLLDGPVRRPCQRLGASRAIALVAPARPAAERGMATDVLLQQLYFGALDDPSLTAFVAADFEPRGYLPAGDSPFDADRVLMIWDNPRQS